MYQKSDNIVWFVHLEISETVSQSVADEITYRQVQCDEHDHEDDDSESDSLFVHREVHKHDNCGQVHR